MHQQNKSISVIAVSALFIFALNTSSVLAHGPGHDDDHEKCEHCEEKIAKMDDDGDGKISRREFMKFHGDKFDKYDLNNDRFLDADEVHYMMEDMHKHMHDDEHEHAHDGDGEHAHQHSHDEDKEHDHDHH